MCGTWHNVSNPAFSDGPVEVGTFGEDMNNNLCVPGYDNHRLT
jgi:hypothetical protein